jgi:hypothetical protein
LLENNITAFILQLGGYFMKGKVNKGKNFYIYLILSLILFIGSIVFYVSCQSKSPTDAAVPSTENLTARGTKSTTQTTTSSSTTTTIKPLNPAATSSTIITSRNLTTTTIGAAPTTTTASQGPDVQFCNIKVVYVKQNYPGLSAKTAPPQNTFIQNGGTIRIPIQGYCVKIFIRVKNVGGAPANNVKVVPEEWFVATLGSFNRGASNFFELPVIHTLENDGFCRDHPISSWFWFGCWYFGTDTKTDGFFPRECIDVVLKLQWKGSTHSPEFKFKLCFYWPEDN